MDAGYSELLQGWSPYLLLWLFVIYGFLGVVIETVYCLVREGVLESRLGLLYVPLRPMYGIGAVASTVVLEPYLQRPIVVLLGCMVICSVVEYVAGGICEKAFGTMSWDYRGRLLHLHGRICLQYSCYWALLAGSAIYLVNPMITSLVARLDRAIGEIVIAVVIGCAAASAVLTTAAWARVRQRLTVHQTQETGWSAAPQDSVLGRALDRLVPDQLMINTFPRTRLAQELTELSEQGPFSRGSDSSRDRRVAPG